MYFPQAFSGKKKTLFLLILSVLTLFIGIMVLLTTVPLHAQNITPEHNVLASLQEQSSQGSAVISQGERIMKALSAAYPERIGPAELKDGDWAFLVRGKWFYYAEGRILPEDRRNRAAEYRALCFNSNYQLVLPSWESTADQRAARTRSYEESLNRPPQPQTQTSRPPSPGRPNYFYEALWNGSTREQIQSEQVRVNFLGRQITVHSDLSQKMILINEIIVNESRTNPSVRQWIDSLGTITGWNWRNVASSGNRSFHSYGIAVDILPVDLRGLATYWLWSSQHTPQWWNIPYSGRWHPPDEVIRAFESFGFTWGGKWANFDTMHFEYRPEVFILSDIPIQR